MRLISCLVLLLLTVGLAFGQSGVINVPVDKTWAATPDWCPFEKAAKYETVAEQGYTSLRASGGKGTMIWVRNPNPRLDVRNMRYVSLRYRATNVVPDLPSYLLYLDTGDSGAMYARNLIFGANDLICDGQWHNATTQLHPFGEIGAMALRIRAQAGQEGRLDVAYLRFSAEPPRNSLGEILDWHAGADGVGGSSVVVGDLATEDLPALQQAVDLGDWFTGEQVVVNGVNFRVPLTGKVAAVTAGETPQQSPLAVPVKGKGAALYLLLGAKFPYKMLNYAGWAPGDMTDRPEQFRVLLKYADGTQDEQVPYCLGQRGYGVWRGLQAYCLPLAPGRELREAVLWDGMRTSTFHLVAATVGERSLAPVEPDLPQRTPAGQGPAKMKPAVLRQGRAILMQGPWGEMAFGYHEGFALTAISNARHPQWPVEVAGRVPLFSIRDGDKVYRSQDFDITNPSLDFYGTKAIINFAHAEAKLSAALTLEATATEARMRLTVTNLGDQPRNLDVTFPQAELKTSRPRDLWYFYPTSAPVWSNADREYDKAYSGWFPVQFADAYDRAGGGGLYVGTRDQSLRQRYYQLAKSGSNLRLGIEYRDNPPLGPNTVTAYPVSVIGLHGGDWRPAWQAYLTWFKSWYKPSHPRPAWYQQVWNFRTWWTHTMGDGRPEWNVYDKQTGQFQQDKFIAKDRGLFGDIDMVHYFDWRITEKYGSYGDFSHYEHFGGLEKFRAMVQAMQKAGVRVGLYLDAYLCSHASLIGQAHGKEWAQGEQGGNLSDAYSTPQDPKWGMCVNVPAWQDHLAQASAQAARDTGCDGIYIDEAMTDLPNYWCWRKDHGHPVPAPVQPGLFEIARKTRKALPANVALYAEWSPSDVFLPYLDGAYQANPAHCDIRFSPGFLQLTRFVAPDFKVFTISNGGSMYDGIWEGMKYSFFSGVPLYSLSYGHDDAAYEPYRKMSKLLHEHGDAFTSASPQPFIQTERAGLYANAFPGKRETVWTLWNARYRTLTGVVLKVKHVPGARYRDVWNGQELKVKVGRDGLVNLTTTLGPRGIGAVAQVRP